MKSPANFRLRALVLSLGVVLLLAELSGCGGGGGGTGGGGGGGGGQTGDFSLTVTPSQITLTGGSSASVSVQLIPINGFGGSVAVQTTGLPSGITVSPATFNLIPAAQQI